MAGPSDRNLEHRLAYEQAAALVGETMPSASAISRLSSESACWTT